MILGLINRAINGYLVISCFCVFICFTYNPNLAQADELGMNVDVGIAPSLNDTAKKQAEKKWSVSGSAGIQFDDNVNSDPVDTTSDEDDIAAVLDVSLGYQLLKKSLKLPKTSKNYPLLDGIFAVTLNNPYLKNHGEQAFATLSKDPFKLLIESALISNVEKS